MSWKFNGLPLNSQRKLITRDLSQLKYEILQVLNSLLLFQLLKQIRSPEDLIDKL